jgi:hypothetical protein
MRSYKDSLGCVQVAFCDKDFATVSSYSLDRDITTLYAHNYDDSENEGQIVMMILAM